MRSSAEFERIRYLIEAVDGPSSPEVRLGPGDDAATLRVGDDEILVLSTDLSVEDVHFRRVWLTWEAIGYRAVAAALSDLAAMAARPIGVLVSLALPRDLDSAAPGELARGLGSCLREQGAALLGGDLSLSPGPVVLDVTVVGATRHPVERSGARAGDELWVTGSLGGAAAAAAAWSAGLEPEPGARAAFERPVPRTAESRWLVSEADVHALIDLSDGLAADAEHVAAASGVRLELEAAAIPLHPVLETWAQPEAALSLAVGGGEDYELLAALGPGFTAAVREAFEREFGVGLTRVGRVTEGSGVDWMDERGSVRQPPAAGFDHFGGGD
jgi:thiamine-monophosphate kinase